MVGWTHRLNGHEFEQTAGDSEGQGSLVCCSPWGCKELNTTQRLKNNNNIFVTIFYLLLCFLFLFFVFHSFSAFCDFKLSYKAGLLTTDSLKFCLSEKVLFSPSFLKDNLTEYRTLGWGYLLIYFYFSAKYFTLLFPCLHDF